MPAHRMGKEPRGGWGLPVACSVVATVSFGIICVSSGSIRLTAGLCLLGAFTSSLWLVHRIRFPAIVSAVGLSLVFFILAGLGLAAAHALSTVPTALAIEVVTLAAVRSSVFYQSPELAERRARLKPSNPLAVIGVLIFAAAVVLAVRYATASATADSNGASSLAVWAYPAGTQLHVGAQQPPGHGAASLRIVVTQAGVTAAAWNNIRLAPGQTWEAPALTLTGNGPVQVIAFRGGHVVASLSASPR
jgi:hypothetical protein